MLGATGMVGQQFLRLLESYRHEHYAPESLAVTDLAEWLQANCPPDGKPGIMHGDPHLSNVLLRRDKPELAAFVDWEMCTVGDPLLDLGWMLICWPLETNTITAGAAPVPRTRPRTLPTSSVQTSSKRSDSSSRCTRAARSPS